MVAGYRLPQHFPGCFGIMPNLFGIERERTDASQDTVRVHLFADCKLMDRESVHVTIHRHKTRPCRVDHVFVKQISIGQANKISK